MIKKPCKPSKELQALRILNKRMNLNVHDQQYYYGLEKGHEGEKIMNQWLLQLQQDAIIINDLMIEQQHSFFQIDILVLTHGQAHLFEVKHFEGDYYVKDNRFYLMNDREVKNPFHQLQRSEALIRDTFQKIHLSLPIKAQVAYTNPSFSLYHACPDFPLLLPGQIKRFIQKWNNEPFAPLPDYYHSAAEKLLKLNWEYSPYTRLPDYDYHSLKKGITCPACSSWMLERKNKLVCSKCGCTEDRRNGILRSAEEFNVLFPREKITTNGIHHWCGLQSSTKNVSRVLLSHYQRFGKGKGSYYQAPPVGL
ncbi:NERD domain-containing protein [Salibacterium lacus]|uniref:NERD domain-containing protein n=1 Tax=Salibacterium lacus TaxID=1898109 RepID=A0ABW5T323_9BACI